MKQPYMHASGESLYALYTRIQKAIFSALKKEYARTRSTEKTGHFWYGFLNFHNRTIHPAVIAALEVGPPTDLHQLALEAPHLSADGKRLAYTQNDDKGRRNTQTVTTPGKYLRRHFPEIEDHVIRSLAEIKIGCRLINTMPEMLHAIYNGPKSCMKWGQNEDRKHHPYEAYDPALGWGMAVNEENGKIIGRAIVHFGHMCFVRTYRTDGERTQACNLMQDWLKNKGFEHAEAWPEGTKILRLVDAAPYLDGGCKRVFSRGDYWVVSEKGNYVLDNTDGHASCTEEDQDDADYAGECVDCGDSCYTGDDYILAGIDADKLVCSDCHEQHYVYAIGRNGRDYNIRYRNAIEIRGVWYDAEYLSDQDDLVCTTEGEYCHIDDMFFCSVVGEYYETEVENAIELANGEKAAECNAWQCSMSDEWYGNDENINQVTLNDGCIAHQDNCWRCVVSNAWYGDNDMSEKVVLEDGSDAHSNHCWQCSVTEKWYSNDDSNYTFVDGYIHNSALQPESIYESA